MAGRKPVVETPEFQEAVAKAVDEKLEAFKRDLFEGLDTTDAAVEAAPKSGDASDLMSDILSKLTMNLAAVNQQGERKKPLTPEEVLRRERAHNQMVDLIIASRQEGGQRPAYKLTSKVYLNERFIEPFKIVDRKAVNNEITWTGVPNDAMAPINAMAEQIFAAWRESTGGPTKLVPTADNRPFYTTAAGLTVKGDPPKRQHVAADPNFQDDLGFINGDPNAPEVAVLGTIAPKARNNAVTGVQ